MRSLRWLLWAILSIWMASLCLQKPHLPAVFWYNFPGLFDAEIFDNDTSNPSVFVTDLPKVQAPPYSQDFEPFLHSSQTAAFLVLHQDSLLMEWYEAKETSEMGLGSFSMAKTVVALLFWRLFEERILLNWDAPVYPYIPNWARSHHDSLLTFRHLVEMTANLDWDESYDLPMSKTTEAYYGNDLERLMRSLHTTEVPGRRLNYQSCNQIFLAFLFRKLTGFSITQGLERYLWKPMGTEAPILWSLDHEQGLEKAFCCLSAKARDYMRLGRICLHEGTWKSFRFLHPVSYQNSLKVSNVLSEDGDVQNDYYAMGWWITDVEYDGKTFKAHYMRGILGQYLVIIPEAQLVILRMGHHRDPKRIGQHRADVFEYMRMGLKLSERKPRIPKP